MARININTQFEVITKGGQISGKGCQELRLLCLGREDASLEGFTILRSGDPEIIINGNSTPNDFIDQSFMVSFPCDASGVYNVSASQKIVLVTRIYKTMQL